MNGIGKNITTPHNSKSSWHYIETWAIFTNYNAKQVFANKFIYFLFAAVVLFFFIIVVYSLDSETPPDAGAIFNILLAPGTLLIFYPSVYSLQNDVDSRMLETLFGIPNYRYKVWLARNIIQYITVAILLCFLALFSRYALTDFQIVSMIFHLMFPIIFLGSTAFAVSTVTRSGNGAAVVMVIIGLFFWIAEVPLSDSRWNLFHNPFSRVEQIEMLAWIETTLYNRIYIVIGTILSTMYSLLRLQKREKFM